MAVFALLSFSFSLFWHWEECLQNIFTYSPKHQSQKCRQFQDVNNLPLLRYFKLILNLFLTLSKEQQITLLWVSRSPILLLQGHFPAEFCSSTLAWMLLFILKTLAGWFKSNQIKSLLLSHHHSTSALVSEILMSVLQTVQKNNRQFTYGQTVQKNNNKQFTYGQTVQKKQQTIYIWTDSAKNCTGAFTVLQTVQKKQQQQFTYGQTVQKNNSNLHMDSTYLQTVQKTMCKIHIHVISTLSVL